MENQDSQKQWQSDRMSRIERRRQRRGGSAMGGVLLIGLAILLLLENQGTLSFGRWWALLIMIPAIGAFVNAGKEFRSEGSHLTRLASFSLISGLILTAITGAILFNLDWGWFGPALLLLAGIGLMGRSFNSSTGA